MNKKNWSNTLSASARILLAFIFVFGQTAWAGQVQNVEAKPGSSAGTASQQAPPNLSATSAKVQPEEESGTTQGSSARENPHRGGQHEGIKVHGHWTIEVRSRDGALVRHVEFENSLDPGFAIHIPSPPAPQPINVQVPGGAAYLSALLGGQPVQAPVWSIWLVGPAGLNNLFNSTGAACSQSSSALTPSSVQGASVGACTINMPSASFCSGAAPSPGASCNLSVSTLGTAPALTGIQLSGSVTATQNGQVSTVATIVTNTASFTSSTNFPGAPISVLAGQTVAVTVIISFS